MKKPAFTLVELIMVVTIIGILTAFVVLDFRSAIQRQEMKVAGDQVSAILQQARADVDFGIKSESENGPILLCKGAVFSSGEMPMAATANFDKVGSECDLGTLTEENYGISSKTALVESIRVGNSNFSSVLLLFEAPDAEVVFYSEGEKLSGDAEILITHSNNEDLKMLLKVSSQTGQISLSKPEEMKNKAFTLIEVVIGVTLMALVIVAVAGLILATMMANQRNIQTVQALGLAQEGLEVMRYVRDSNWLQNYSWDHEFGGENVLYLKKSLNCPPCWVFQSDPEKIILGNSVEFSRKILIKKVVENGFPQEGILEIIARIDWKNRGADRSLELSTFLTDWR